MIRKSSGLWNLVESFFQTSLFLISCITAFLQSFFSRYFTLIFPLFSFIIIVL